MICVVLTIKPSVKSKKTSFPLSILCFLNFSLLILIPSLQKGVNEANFYTVESTIYVRRTRNNVTTLSTLLLIHELFFHGVLMGICNHISIITLLFLLFNPRQDEQKKNVFHNRKKYGEGGWDGESAKWRKGEMGKKRKI